MDRTNKHTPNIIYRVESHPGIAEPVHIFRASCYAAKFKDGKYRPSVDQYIAFTQPIGTEGLLDKLLDDHKQRAEQALLRGIAQQLKKGRYHDWFYAPAII